MAVEWKSVRPYIPAVVLLVVVIGLAWKMTHDRNKIDDITRERDRLQLQLAGINTADPTNQHGVTNNIDPNLQIQINNVNNVTPGTTPVASTQGHTGAVTAGGIPRPSVPCPTTPTTPNPDGGMVPPVVMCPACLLAPGDKFDIKTSAVVLETKGGAFAVVAQGTLVRLTPPPETEIGTAPLQLTTKYLAPKPPGGWGAGPLATAALVDTVIYGGVGVAVSFPPADLGPVTLDVSAGATFIGLKSLSVQALIRF